MRKNMGLYRGKRKHDGKWLEGTYLHLNLGRDFICDGTVWIGTLNPCKEEIIPETAGQFTGLTDKNGKKIFEGDVVKAERICNGKAWQGIVVWWNGCFAIQGIKDRNVPAIDLFVEYEVIGNIHDNKELLNETENSAIDSSLDKP